MRSLSHNWLGAEGAAALAPALAANGALTRVDVRRNNIAGDGAVQLAAAVLCNLKIEMFNEIPIKEMRANSLTKLDLKRKDVGDEGGMVVAGLIPVMGALTKMSLADNNLGEEGTKAICEALEQNKTLKELDISEGTAGAKHVANMLCVNVALTKLSLAQNKLEEAGTKSICKALEQNTTLKELDISGDHCGSNTGGSAGAKHVAKMVRVNGALTKLSLAQNKLEEVGTKAICEALEQNTTLKELDISGGYKGNIGGSAGAKHVAKMLGVNGGLTSINLSENALCGVVQSFGGVSGTYTAEGITAIADALRVNGGLTSIDLSGNQLCGIWTDDDGDQHGTYTAEGITAIADALRVNGGLTKLSLAINNLMEEGTKAICEALEQNRTLKELDISGGEYHDNIGGSAGAKHVAKMLGVNGALTALNLFSNDLKDEGVSAVCEAIQSNKETKLASLNFGNNGIHPVGANAVAAMVAVTGALTALDLSFNDLNDDGVSAVCEAIQNNKETKLASLNMGANSIGPVGAKSVAAMAAVTGGLTKMRYVSPQTGGTFGPKSLHQNP